MTGTDLVLMEPLVAAGTDLRGMPFMPLEVSRLVDSDLVALSTGDEFKAAVVLWAKSWMQVPAASLPSEDRILARLAGLSLPEWKTVREMALHGWVKCSDGRLYHPVIADQAARAAAKSTSQSARAKSRWAKVKTQDNSTNGAMPRHPPGISAGNAQPMQGEVEGEVKEKKNPSGSKKTADKPPSSTRGSRLAHDWSPDPFQHAEALNEGFTAAQTERMALTFRDYWIAQPGQRGVRTDWGAVWRNWLRREAEKRPPASTTSVDGWVPFQ